MCFSKTLLKQRMSTLFSTPSLSLFSHCLHFTEETKTKETEEQQNLLAVQGPYRKSDDQVHILNYYTLAATASTSNILTQSKSEFPNSKKDRQTVNQQVTLGAAPKLQINSNSPSVFLVLFQAVLSAFLEPPILPTLTLCTS